MGLTKEESQIRERLKGSLLTVLGNLDNLEISDALSFTEWMITKSRLYAEGLLRKRFQALPEEIHRGDIVLCAFGTNVFPEFSDKELKHHFAIVWVQQGYNFIVIPITQKQPSKPNPFLIPLGKIPHLPAICNYAKLDAIRSVSLRRIARISGQPDGKIVYPEIKEKISLAFQSLYIDNE